MYGDSDRVRRRATELRDQGADVRALADQLVARTQAVGWGGRAADAMRTRVADRATHLRTAADAHVGAADALERHARSVDAVKDEIAAVEARVADLVGDARGRIAAIAARNEQGDGPTVTPDPEDELLAAFAPPPPGHRDWLSVELPGL
ncbi:WXG100 family type VII secretion target [Nocardioides sp. SYSU DS0651]|uniref:WXG100 family type VII secretion target n=1 Tax=Nocardioides sp. SYSU DS0651 TaxID=3415955 RepID=UPI003F4B720C